MHRLGRPEFFEQFVGKSRFGFRREVGRFFARELGKDSEFGLQISRGNSIPKSVFEREHLEGLLFD